MLNNLLYLEFIIENPHSKALQHYLQLLNLNKINNPIIFTDSCKISIHKNIPIFHSFYIRHLFRDKHILINYQDYQVLRDGYHNVGKCIVLHDGVVATNSTHIFLSNSSPDLLKEVIDAIR
jgi:hypothetical protein